MSLIHQALKSLEPASPGPRPEGSSFFGAAKRGYGYKGAALAVLLLVGFASFAAFIFTASPPSPAPQATAKPASPLRSEALAIGDHNAKGVAQFRLGRMEEALKEFEAGVALHPEDPVLHNNLALAYMKLGDRTRAEASFKKALELNPDYPEAFNNYASLIDAKGKSRKAVPIFKKAVRLNPLYADAQLNLAISLERIGRFSEAASHYEKFLSLGTDESLANEVRKKIIRLRTDFSRRDR